MRGVFLHVDDYRGKMIAAVGVVIGALMVVIKVVPFIPGHFSQYEWLALGAWIMLGLLLHRRSPTPRLEIE